MTRRSHIVALAAVFALTGVSVIVAAQQRPNRVSDQQVRDLLIRMDVGIAAFRANFDQAIDRSRMNGSREEDDINQSVNDFEQATDRVQNRRAGATDVEDVMRRASVIDGFIMRNALGAAVERAWQSLRGDLDELARVWRHLELDRLTECAVSGQRPAGRATPDSDEEERRSVSPES